MKIAGVPEHFNLPFHLSLENGGFERAGVPVGWTDVPEGTGKLCQMLRSGEADMAVILTEGIIKDILAGNPSKIIQVYVKSPLLWGVHVAAGSDFREMADLEGKTAAISRLGSGSELMAYVNAAEQGWSRDSVRFEIVHTLSGAVEALPEGRADYFLWERFMTQPIVDRGIFRRIGVCPTPWPSFVIAVRDQVWAERPEQVRAVLDAVNATTAGFKIIPGIVRILAQRYGQQEKDLETWLGLTEWTNEPLTPTLLNNIQIQLLENGIIEKKGTFAQIATT